MFYFVVIPIASFGAVIACPMLNLKRSVCVPPPTYCRRARLTLPLPSETFYLPEMVAFRFTITNCFPSMDTVRLFYFFLPPRAVLAGLPQCQNRLILGHPPRPPFPVAVLLFVCLFRAPGRLGGAKKAFLVLVVLPEEGVNISSDPVILPIFRRLFYPTQEHFPSSQYTKASRTSPSLAPP